MAASVIPREWLTAIGGAVCDFQSAVERAASNFHESFYASADNLEPVDFRGNIYIASAILLTPYPRDCTALMKYFYDSSWPKSVPVLRRFITRIFRGFESSEHKLAVTIIDRRHPFYFNIDLHSEEFTVNGSIVAPIMTLVPGDMLEVAKSMLSEIPAATKYEPEEMSPD